MKNKAKDETKYKITDENYLKNISKVGEEGFYFKKRKKINAVFYIHIHFLLCWVLVEALRLSLVAGSWGCLCHSARASCSAVSHL